MRKSLLGALVLATFRNGRDELVTRPGVVVADNGETCNLQVETDGVNDFPNGRIGIWLGSQRQATDDHPPTEGEFTLRCLERLDDQVEELQRDSRRHDRLLAQHAKGLDEALGSPPAPVPAPHDGPVSTESATARGETKTDAREEIAAGEKAALDELAQLVTGPVADHLRDQAAAVELPKETEADPSASSESKPAATEPSSGTLE